MLSRILIAAIAALAIVIVLQWPGISLHGIFTRGGIWTRPEMSFIDFAVGLINSSVTCGICLLIVQKPVIAILATAVVVQILWLEIMQRTYGVIETFSDLVYRISCHAGILLAAVLLYALTAILRSHWTKGAPR
jgi:hypothetical protein